MQTIDTTNIPSGQLDALEDFAQNSPDVGPELRDALRSIVRCVREGSCLLASDGSPVLTPQQAAEHLGMSRTHLYKLLDRGEITSHRVGRDRRIHLTDLIAFEAQRQRDSRELAERFAHQNTTHSGAIDELADLI
jgi:excisionase family DNA binding protein